MLTKEQELYGRYVRLLRKCGTRLLQLLILKALNKRVHRITFSQFLDANRRRIKNNRHLTPEQISTLYPDTPQSVDIDVLDISLSSFLIRTYLSNQLEPSERSAANELREIRNEQGHSNETEMTPETYKTERKRLQKIIHSGSLNLSEREQDELREIQTECLEDSIDLQTVKEMQAYIRQTQDAIQDIQKKFDNISKGQERHKETENQTHKTLQQLTKGVASVDQKTCDIEKTTDKILTGLDKMDIRDKQMHQEHNEKLEKMLKQLDRFEQKLPENKLNRFVQIPALSCTIYITAPDQKTACDAEHLLFHEFETFISKSPPKDVSSHKLSLCVKKFLNDIHKLEVTVDKVEIGSIVLKLTVASLPVPGIRSLYDYIRSRRCQELLQEMSEALTDIIGSTVSITAYIDKNVLEDIIQQICKEYGINMSEVDNEQFPCDNTPDQVLSDTQDQSHAEKIQRPFMSVDLTCDTTLDQKLSDTQDQSHAENSQRPIIFEDLACDNTQDQELSDTQDLCHAEDIQRPFMSEDLTCDTTQDQELSDTQDQSHAEDIQRPFMSEDLTGFSPASKFQAEQESRKHKIQFQMKFSNIGSLKRLLEEFMEGRTDNCLKELSAALSSACGKPVTLHSSLNMEQLGEAIAAMEQQLGKEYGNMSEVDNEQFPCDNTRDQELSDTQDPSHAENIQSLCMSEDLTRDTTSDQELSDTQDQSHAENIQRPIIFEDLACDTTPDQELSDSQDQSHAEDIQRPFISEDLTFDTTPDQELSDTHDQSHAEDIQRRPFMSEDLTCDTTPDPELSDAQNQSHIRGIQRPFMSEDLTCDTTPGQELSDTQNQSLAEDIQRPFMSEDLTDSSPASKFQAEQNMSKKDQEKVGQSKGCMSVSSNSRSSDRTNQCSDQIVALEATARVEEHRNEHTESKEVFADNAMSRRIDRVGESRGSMPHPSKRTDGENKAELMRKEKERFICVEEDTRSNVNSTAQNKPTAGHTLPPDIPPSESAETYDDNAYNRKLGRVGGPSCSHEVSKCFDLKCPRPESYETFSGNRSTKQTKELVSEHLQSMPRGGTHTLQLNARKERKSSDSSDETSSKQKLDDTNAMHAKGKESIKVYVDKNRKLGKVDLPYGDTPDTAKSQRVYVDNTKNRNLGRVGLPYESAKADIKEDAGKAPSSEVYKKKIAGFSASSGVYKDTPQNRRLGRVGKPKGSMVFSKITGSIEMQLYQDSSLNRRLGRVGQPRGSKPFQKTSSTTRKIPEMLRKIQNNKEGLDFDETEDRDEAYFSAKGVHENTARSSKEAYEEARLLNNRLLEEKSWKRLSADSPKTVPAISKDYTGKKIPYSELKLHRPIGKGGFGVVYFAKWNDSVVAVKKLRVENTSQWKIDGFFQEVMKYCTLYHDNIVKFIGACVELPNLCIVMEYMQMSLFDLLHVKEALELQDEEKLDILRQICQGMLYLHSNRIAHCDLKPRNILMDYVQNEMCHVKLTDFGLSMIKDEGLTSTTDFRPLVRNIGTPRYSAPEILRGEVLSAKDMMKTDIYSLGLVCFEVIFEEEPFADLTRDQIKEQIGHNGKVMSIPQGEISDDVRDIIVRSWSLRPDERPKMIDFCQVFSGCQHIV